MRKLQQDSVTLVSLWATFNRFSRAHTYRTGWSQTPTSNNQSDLNRGQFQLRLSFRKNTGGSPPPPMCDVGSAVTPTPVRLRTGRPPTDLPASAEDRLRRFVSHQPEVHTNKQRIDRRTILSRLLQHGVESSDTLHHGRTTQILRPNEESEENSRYWRQSTQLPRLEEIGPRNLPSTGSRGG
jgi:hypothetical protein